MDVLCKWNNSINILTVARLKGTIMVYHSIKVIFCWGPCCVNTKFIKTEVSKLKQNDIVINFYGTLCMQTHSNYYNYTKYFFMTHFKGKSTILVTLCWV